MIYVGLDISKDTIDVHLIDHLETWLKIDNDSAGWQSLLDLLAKYPEEPIRACCEYTGIYYLGVATALYEAGYRISVVNAYSIKHYARLMMRRTKTDRKDAQLIADYLRVNDPPDWQPPAEELAQIKRLNRRLGQLVAMRTMEENRRQVADESCAASCTAIIDSVEAQIVAVEALLQNIIGGDAKLKEKQKLLMSIPGLGKKSAAILLPEVAEIDRFPTPKHLVSYIGLSPIQRESGTSVRTKGHISKMGNKHVRSALFMPARSACLRSRVFKDWAKAHMERGKAPKVVYVMMMRKILTYAWHVFKENQPFDEKILKRS